MAFTRRLNLTGAQRGGVAMAVMLAALLGAAPDFDCCEQPQPPDLAARPPILPAPLLREPASDEEAANMEIVRTLLRSRQLGVTNGDFGIHAQLLPDSGPPDRTIPADSPLAAYLSQIDDEIYFAGSPGGRFAVNERSAARMTVLEFAEDGRSLTVVFDSTLPEEFGTCFFNTDPLRPEWLSERYLLARRSCSDCPCQDLLIDLESGTWSDAGKVRPYYADETGLYFWDAGTVQTPTGEFDAPADCQHVAISDRYVVCGSGLYDYRAGRDVTLTTPDGETVTSLWMMLSPSRSSLLAMESDGRLLRLFDLNGGVPQQVREIALPANNNFVVTDWGVDEQTVLGLFPYPGEMIFVPQCGIFGYFGLGHPGYSAQATATVLVDLAEGRAYQIDEMDPFGNPSWWDSALFRTRTEPAGSR